MPWESRELVFPWFLSGSLVLLNALVLDFEDQMIFFDWVLLLAVILG